jgi:hypothetical protein
MREKQKNGQVRFTNIIETLILFSELPLGLIERE